MTNNKIYFVANWKMYGNLTSLNALNKVINISRSKFFKKAKFIYCPPFTLLDQFVKKTIRQALKLASLKKTVNVFGREEKLHFQLVEQWHLTIIVWMVLSQEANCLKF